MAQIGMQGVRSALGSWDKGSSFVDNYMKGTQIRIAKEQEERAKIKEALSYIKTTLDKGSEIGFLNEADGNAYFRDKIANDPLLQEYQARLGIKNLNLYFDREKGGGVYSEQVPLQNVKKGLAKQWGVSLEDANDIFKKKGLSDNSLVSFERTKSGIGINLDTGVKEGAGKAGFKDTQSLRKEFQEITSDFRSVRDSYTRTKKSYQDPSAAGDLSLIFNYMKMLDPGSVVRESEFAQAEKTGSWGSRIESARLKVLRGERLAPKVRNDFFDRATKIYSGRNNQYKKTSKEFKTLAVKENIDPSKVVLDYSLTEQNNDNKDPLGLF